MVLSPTFENQELKSPPKSAMPTAATSTTSTKSNAYSVNTTPSSRAKNLFTHFIVHPSTLEIISPGKYWATPPNSELFFSLEISPHLSLSIIRQTTGRIQDTRRIQGKHSPRSVHQISWQQTTRTTIPPEQRAPKSACFLATGKRSVKSLLPVCRTFIV